VRDEGDEGEVRDEGEGDSERKKFGLRGRECYIHNELMMISIYREKVRA
jgi:hypothetical protein